MSISALFLSWAQQLRGEMDKLKFSLKELITICSILLALAGSWYSLKGDIEDIKKDNQYMKLEFSDFKTSMRNWQDLVNSRVFEYGQTLKRHGIELPRDPNWSDPEQP